MNLLINSNAKQIPLADGSVNCVVTSPPYYGLRDYGVSGQIGLEQTPDEYIANLVQVFREVKRVLRDDGTLWLNLGDSYAGNMSRASNNGRAGFGSPREGVFNRGGGNIKDKDLIGIPWMAAFALRADGWYLRQDIIWCLSGGTYLYARTQKGDYPMMVRDIARLDPSTVKLWNGDKWTQVLGWSKSHRKDNELEIVLRSGERISCTPNHKFPTNRGLLEASELKTGDCLRRVKLPQPDNPKDCVIDNDAAWFAGLYVAEGSRNHGCIQIAGHVKEEERWQRVQKIAAKFGGSATRTIDGNMMNIRVYGKILNALIDHLVTGRTAKNKGFSSTVWQYSDTFINAMLDGYLSGDGSYDKKNNRWRLGFTRNYNLERDLRTACARLGLKLILNLSTVKYNGKNVPTFRGEIRYFQSNHHNRKDENEIVEIRKSRCREVYDIGVEDEPHVFALASGILTHNSKPNPMPESVKDRCTKAHEYVFLLTKNPQYYYDYEAVLEPSVYPNDNRKSRVNANAKDFQREIGNRLEAGDKTYPYRNKRSVWTVTTKPYKGAHFATFPPDLIKPMILAGCPSQVCAVCGAPYERVVDRVPGYSKECPKTQESHEARGGIGKPSGTVGKSGGARIDGYSTTLGWRPTCNCDAGTTSGIVLDPFVGSGTTVMVAMELGRKGIGLDLNLKYLDVNARERTSEVQPILI